MTRGVRLYLVGSFVLVSLAGCGRGFFQTAEREPWRREAEIACLKSGVVHESASLVRIDPINGPGMCGAEFPLKVSALDTGGTFGFADELRPPGGIPTAQPRWPISPAPQPQAAYPQFAYPESTAGSSYPASSSGTVSRAPLSQPSMSQAPYSSGPSSSGPSSSGPMSLNAPGVRPTEEDEIELPPEGEPGAASPPAYRSAPNSSPGYERAPAEAPLPRLGTAPGAQVAAIGPVTVKPAATLACPIVSVLDKWIAEDVQPAAQRWFGAPVVEIKQISAYSCRGMNGNSNAHISEHAFGNALDVAAFTLADGRRISVQDGWHGLAEEQGFLRDVQGAACRHFNTVLAPGSNVYHYNHIHVDLMRRASGRIICEPAAISGEQVAARVSSRTAYRAEPGVTGSISQRLSHVFSRKPLTKDDEDSIEDETRVTDTGR